eukprot:5612713-Amphidinium_carterae.1
MTRSRWWNDLARRATTCAFILVAFCDVFSARGLLTVLLPGEIMRVKGIPGSWKKSTKTKNIHGRNGKQDYDLKNDKED